MRDECHSNGTFDSKALSAASARRRISWSVVRIAGRNSSIEGDLALCADNVPRPTGLAADVRNRHINKFPQDMTKKEPQMATRQMKMPVKDNSEQEVEEVFSQSKRPERGRYLLQVDRQTKGSYTAAETAKAAALVIKKKYPIVQVSVYDSVDNSNMLVEAPATS
jgi:hypothetical protein